MTTNANSIANDPLPPFRPSGLRLGTPAVTTRGMKEPQMKLIAELIAQAISTGDSQKLHEIQKKSIELATTFPVI